MIKVFAIVAFLGICALALTGLWPGRSAGLPGLAAQELAPGGGLAVVTGLLVVLFSYGGSEIVAVAAAETADPERSLRRATRQVVGRICLFYVLSVAAIIALLPTDRTPTDSSPFAAVLRELGLPAAGTVMNLVVFCALLSAMNSALYASSRMLYGLALAGDAPSRLRRLDGRGVPRPAMAVSAGLSTCGVLVALVSPDTAFLILLGAASAVTIPLYLLLATAQLRLRRHYERTDPSRLTVKMWFHPFGTYVLMAAVAAVGVAMVVVREFLPQVLLTLAACLITLGCYAVRRRRPRVSDPVPAG